MKDKVELKICYEGQVHQMDLDILLGSLLRFAEMIKAVSREIMPEEHIQIKVNATEKGSFIVDLELVKHSLGLLDFFNNNATTISTLSALLTIVVSIFEVKKFLAGKKPDSVIYGDNNDIIIAKDNAQIKVNRNVYNIYSRNSDVNTNMGKFFDKLLESPEIEGFTVDAGEAGRFSTSKDSFSDLAAENELLEEEKIKELIEDVCLTITKVVFQPKRKWEFIYEGNRISALIKDINFWSDVDSGMKFSKGDKLHVILEVTKVYDNENACYVNTDFCVVKVLKHDQRAVSLKQGKLF